MTLSLVELIEQSAVEDALVQELVRIGVTTASSEPFERGDVQRIITAAAYLDAGFTIEQLASSIAARALSFEFADAFQLEPTEPSGRTVADLAESLGVSVERLRAVYGAFGLPIPEASTRTRMDEEELVAAFVSTWRIATDDEATIRAARLFGDSARRASEGWVDLFVEQVSLPSMAIEETYESYAAATLAPATRLVELAPRLLVWLQQVHSTRAMRAVNLELFERDLVARQVIPQSRRDPPVIAFADLVGYTQMTEAHGDALAVRVAGGLQDLAEAAVRAHGGRVVKLLGDGVMFRFADLGTATSALLELVETVPASGLGPAHLGMERGLVIERDGDVFGRTVNLAARIAGAAAPGEVLAGPDAAAGLGADARFAIEPAGIRELKGVATPTAVHRVRRASG